MAEAKTILMLGDSLTEWNDWAARFPAHRVHNLGISGETVEWLLDRLPRITGGHPRADAVFLMTGINNVSMDDTGFMPDYQRIVEGLRAAYPGAAIYVQSLLPTLLPWVGAHAVEVLNRALRGVASGAGVEFIDVATPFMEAGLKDCLSPDGIHLSPRGYDVWARTIEPFVNR